LHHILDEVMQYDASASDTIPHLMHPGLHLMQESAG
jgi:hypothetical protein